MAANAASICSSLELEECFKIEKAIDIGFRDAGALGRIGLSNPRRAKDTVQLGFCLIERRKRDMSILRPAVTPPPRQVFALFDPVANSDTSRSCAISAAYGSVSPCVTP
jgi:hypothetical protein